MSEEQPTAGGFAAAPTQHSARSTQHYWSAPAPLTRGQRAALVAAAVIAAGSRFLARGHSMWDWDEALFCLGVRDYNVVQHHPHPPGYPLFLAAAKLMRLAVDSDF